MTHHKPKVETKLLVPVFDLPTKLSLNVVQLLKTFRAGGDGGFALADALEESGVTRLLAEHFRTSCLPPKKEKGKPWRCVVAEALARPKRFSRTVKKKGYFGDQEYSVPNPLTVILYLHAAGLSRAYVEYRGVEDSMDYEYVHFYRGDEEVELAEDKPDDFGDGVFNKSWYHVVANFALEHTGRGWENNEGAHGEYDLDLVNATGELRHTYYDYDAPPDDLDEDEDWEGGRHDGSTSELSVDYFKNPNANVGGGG